MVIALSAGLIFYLVVFAYLLIFDLCQILELTQTLLNSESEEVLLFQINN